VKAEAVDGGMTVAEVAVLGHRRSDLSFWEEEHEVDP
jgi:hypothetical protein